MNAPPVRRRLGVNLLWLVPGVVGGSEEYTTRLLRAIGAAAPDDLDLTLFALPDLAEAHPDLVAAHRTVLAPVDGRRKPERVAAEASWLAREAGRHRIELLHHAGGVVPPGPVIARTTAVVTIHDLQPLVHPEHFSPVKRRWLATMLPRSVRRASHVFVPTDPVADSVVSLLGVPRDRVLTVPHGVESPEPVGVDRLAEVADRYHLDGRSILFPAIPYPHKDHRTLIRAFARLAAEVDDVTLVLSGGPGPSEAEVAAEIRRSGVGQRIRRTGRVPWDDLEALYALASVVAFPSRFEGFGAPTIEAMVRGVPLVAADASALPWVVGDAGLLVPPGDEVAWAAALGRVLADPAEAERLAAAGRVRAETFTWTRAATAALAAYRQAFAAIDDPAARPGDAPDGGPERARRDSGEGVAAE